MNNDVWQKYGQALGCDIDLRVKGIEKTKAIKLFSELWKTIEVFEARFSRFIKSSELSNFNENAGKKIIISKELESIIRESIKMSELTNGAYNPFILPALHRSGYLESMTEKSDVQTELADFSNRDIAGWQALKVGNGWAQIPANTAIDMGGIGKGFLSDMISHSLDEKNIESYFISLGGDIVAKGKNDWLINIQSANDRTKDIAIFESCTDKFAIASSGKNRKKKNRNQEHQIDVRTGKTSDTNILISTVAGTSATVADVLASTILITGIENAESFVSRGMLKAAFIQEADEEYILGSGIKLLSKKTHGVQYA